MFRLHLNETIDISSIDKSIFYKFSRKKLKTFQLYTVSDCQTHGITGQDAGLHIFQYIIFWIFPSDIPIKILKISICCIDIAYRSKYRYSDNEPSRQCRHVENLNFNVFILFKIQIPKFPNSNNTLWLWLVLSEVIKWLRFRYSLFVYKKPKPSLKFKLNNWCLSCSS